MDTDFLSKFSMYRILEEGKMNSKNKNTTIYNDKLKYPEISDKLIECLKRDFPDELPRKEISAFEYGRLTGRQDIIDKLEFEKSENEPD